MRARWLSLTALLIGSAAALAQQPTVQPGAPGAEAPRLATTAGLDPANNMLDAVLIRWEQAMGSLNSLHAKVTRTSIDKVFMSTEVYEGEAKYLKPNKASLWLQNKDPKKTQEFERLVCNGQTAYKWEPSKKEIHIHELPKPKQGQINDDNFVSMLFGMKALEAKRRYTLRLLDPPANDKLYCYILIEPRDSQDKAEFTRARLVLTINTYLPRQIWFEQPNGNETSWDFPNVVAGAQIRPEEFSQPTPPAGWQLKRVTMQEGPRVVRPQDGK